MEVRRAGELAEIAASPLAADLVGDVVVVDLQPDPATPGMDAAPTLPCVVVAITGPDAPGRPPAPPWVDVAVADAAGAERVAAAAQANPLAATALALHLRASERQSVADALVAESATYSLLQSGPEHARWLADNAATRGGPTARAARAPRPPAGGDDRERVRVERDGAAVHIALARPGARNAVDAAMQQALVDALATVGDGDKVVVTGDGRVFSAGGDLDEFGSLADPASAHLLRLRRSPARALARVADRATVIVHGACHGAGVELPAFAGRVVARPGTTFTLPEVGMGLIPGAGGTVSLPRRIGRHRTAWLAITGQPMDADTALRWGLVDEIG
jgi:Enoyl-CoA hydratase/isomerase